MPEKILHRLVAVVGVACLIVLVWATFASRGASVRPDELGFLLNGWVLTGTDEVLFGDNFRSFYTAGFGFVTGAAAVVAGGIDGQYRISLLVNIGLVVATAAALARLAFGHFSVSRRMSRSLAIVVAVAPAVAANSLFAWSESLNRFLFVALTLLAYEHLRRPRLATSLTMAVTSSYMVIAHGRFTLVPVLTVVLFAAPVATNALAAGIPRLDKRLLLVSAAGIATTIVSYLVFTRINVWLRSELYPAASGKEGRMVDKLLTSSNLPSLGRSAVGQLWYVLATSFGLAAAGLLVNIRSIATGMRRPRNLQWLAPAFVFATAGTVALASALQILRVIRPDHLVYGRYLEAVSPVFVMLGLCAVTAGSRFAFRAWVVGIGAVVVCAAVLTAAAGRDELRAMTSARKFFAIPNAIALDWGLKLTKPAGYLSLTFAFVVVAVVLILSLRANRRLFIALLAALSLAFTSVTAIRTVVPYRDYFDQMTLDDDILEFVSGDRRSTTIMFDSGGLGGQTYYDYRYLLHPVQVERDDVHWINRAPLRCVIGSVARPPEDSGWTVAATENTAASRGKQDRGNIVLWIRAGVDSC